MHAVHRSAGDEACLNSRHGARTGDAGTATARTMKALGGRRGSMYRMGERRWVPDLDEHGPREAWVPATVSEMHVSPRKRTDGAKWCRLAASVASAKSQRAASAE